MERILAIDYGQKRIGVSVSDPNRIIATALGTVNNGDIFQFLGEYIAKNPCQQLVVGYPKNLRNEPADIVPEIEKFIAIFLERFPHIDVVRYDERFTSKMAFQTMIDSGISKKRRQEKSLIDKISATILLENYLESLRGL